MNKFLCLLFSAVILICGVFYFNQGIDFDAIVKKSELKEKKFEKIPQEIITAQGIKYWLIEDTQIELISLSFSFDKAGFAYDTDEKQGVSLIAAQMLDGGTEKYNYQDYHDLLDLNGISIGFNADKDYFNGYMTTPSYNKKQAFEILRQVLFEPRLEETFLKTLQNQFEVSVKTQRETPQSELGVKFKQTIYGNHPYARTVETMASSVSKLNTDDVKMFLENNLNKENLIISIAGNISSNEASQFVDEVFAKFMQTDMRNDLQAPKLNLTPQTISIKRETAQVISSFALKGVKRLDADFYPLYIANHIFGGSGLTSRLSLETREKEGLTYGVYTYLNTDNMAPLISGGFSCVPENYKKMRAILLKQMNLFANKGVTEKELINAKKYLLASFNLRFKSTLELSDMLNLMQKSKLGLDFLQKRNDYIKNVTLYDVNKVANKYFSQELKEVTIGLIE